MSSREQRWYWCEVCETPAVVCKSCGASSCLGGGCERCRDELEAAFATVVAGRAPESEEIPSLGELWNEPEQWLTASDELAPTSPSDHDIPAGIASI